MNPVACRCAVCHEDAEDLRERMELIAGEPLTEYDLLVCDTCALSVFPEVGDLDSLLYPKAQA